MTDSYKTKMYREFMESFWEARDSLHREVQRVSELVHSLSGRVDTQMKQTDFFKMDFRSRLAGIEDKIVKMEEMYGELRGTDRKRRRKAASGGRRNHPKVGRRR